MASQGSGHGSRAASTHRKSEDSETESTGARYKPPKRPSEQGQGDAGDKMDEGKDPTPYVRHLSYMADMFRQVCPSLCQVHGQDYNKILPFQNPGIRDDPDVQLEVAQTAEAAARRLRDNAGGGNDEIISQDAYSVLSQAPFQD